MNQPADSLTAVYLCNLTACHQLARVALDGAERLEKISLAFARGVMDKCFAAVRRAGNEGAMVNASAPDFDEWLRAQDQIGDTLTSTGQQLASTMTEYRAKLNELASNIEGPVQFPVGLDGQAILNFWNQAHERVGKVMQSMSSAPQAESEPPARASAQVKARAR
ncbi:MAG TPA: hypothetical protein VFR86_24265 [Burkholderiaceae bacterium]|nr:hypothetical protein [Burkholderiaceae bacterium]